MYRASSISFTIGTTSATRPSHMDTFPAVYTTRTTPRRAQAPYVPRPSATCEFRHNNRSQTSGNAPRLPRRDSSHAYPTLNTPPLTAGTSSPTRASSIDDDSCDGGLVPPPLTEPGPPVPTPPPLYDTPTLDAPPSPPPTDGKPSAMPEDLPPEPEALPDPPQGPTTPLPFKTLEIQAWRTVYDPNIEGLIK